MHACAWCSTPKKSPSANTTPTEELAVRRRSGKVGGDDDRADNSRELSLLVFQIWREEVAACGSIPAHLHIIKATAPLQSPTYEFSGFLRFRAPRPPTLNTSKPRRHAAAKTQSPSLSDHHLFSELLQQAAGTPYVLEVNKTYISRRRQ